MKATQSEPRFIKLRWNQPTREDVRILADTWDFSYGNLQWCGIVAEQSMPWYFLIKSAAGIIGCGVKVRPNAFVSWNYDAEGVTAWLDVRCGGMGVQLGGRELEVATVVTRTYADGSAFDVACAFCRVMCTDPLLPPFPVYGGNNWYSAYGKSSREDILNAALYQAELAGERENRPFMVIDDGWQRNACDGP